MIHVAHLTKRYGRFTAINDVGFQVGVGEVVGLLGPNGAGKTTTIRILTGYMPATSGSARIGEIDLATAPTAARRSLGYLPETTPVRTDLSVGRYLRMRGALFGLSGTALENRVTAALDACNLRDRVRMLIGRLSKGLRQRVGLAQAILHRPNALILDEPLSGIDPVQLVELRAVIRNLRDAHAILFSSHQLAEVAQVCDRVVVLDRGRVVADRPVDGDSVGRLVLRASGPADQIVERLSTAISSTVQRADDGAFLVDAGGDPGARAAALAAVVVDGGWHLHHLALEQSDLETDFIRLTGGTGP
ncbi:MAG: ABC transporter ATP-binding protein [Pseudomonadota bacterium]